MEPTCGLPYLAPSGMCSCPNPPGHEGPHGMWGTVDGRPVSFCTSCRQVLECLCGESAVCRHCGDVGPVGSDHTCTCPRHDDACTDHPG